MDYKILVPSGIGDFSWMWSKLVTTPHNFHIEYIGGLPDRMNAFLHLLPKDRVLSIRANPDHATKWDENNQLVCFPRSKLNAAVTKVDRLDVMNPNNFYFIENNSWLEAGKRLELWNKDEMPFTDFHYDILGKMVRPLKGNYFIVNFSSYGTKKAWGYYDVPISTDIVEEICKKTGWEAVFIGGPYDDYTQDIYKLLKERNVACHSVVGKTPSLIEVIPLLQQARMYFGACSGLMVLTNNLNVPVATYYPPFPKPPGRHLSGAWHDPKIPHLGLFWDGKENDLCLLDQFIKNC